MSHLENMRNVEHSTKIQNKKTLPLSIGLISSFCFECSSSLTIFSSSTTVFFAVGDFLFRFCGVSFVGVCLVGVFFAFALGFGVFVVSFFGVTFFGVARRYIEQKKKSILITILISCNNSRYKHADDITGTT
jgi:hypothetical protein